VLSRYHSLHQYFILLSLLSFFKHNKKKKLIPSNKHCWLETPSFANGKGRVAHDRHIKGV
jgi:hypothetical protein